MCYLLLLFVGSYDFGIIGVLSCWVSGFLMLFEVCVSLFVLSGF